MNQQFDSSLIPTEAAHDAHWDSTPQCHHCDEDMSDEEVEIEKEQQDSLCDSCRSIMQEGYEF